MQTHLFARRTTASVAAIALSGAALALGAGPSSADDSQGGRPLVAALSGANEVGGGDPDGFGTARITVNPGKNLVCFDISVTNVEGVVAGHIHEAAAGSNGKIVVGLFAGRSTGLQGCVTPTGTTAREVLKDPAGYYVNVHSTAFPSGAVRGQLSK